MDSRQTSDSAIVRFLFEAGNLKRVRRSGWWLAGITHPESVAEHSFRTAVIGYVLACLEGADPERTACLCIFHDFAESRTNDPHHVAKLYVQPSAAGEKILTTTANSFSGRLATLFGQLASELLERNSLESSIAKDADILECVLQAREYQSLGMQNASQWITSLSGELKTSTAQKLLSECISADPSDWWRTLLSTPTDETTGGKNAREP